MANVDCIESLNNFYRKLEDEGLVLISDELRKLIDGASTGTELLTSSRNFIRYNVINRRGIPEHIKYLSKTVVDEIENALGDTFIWNDQA